MSLRLEHPSSPLSDNFIAAAPLLSRKWIITVATSSRARG
jgi:hypothetical protein